MEMEKKLRCWTLQPTGQYSVGSFHRYCVCNLFTVHLIPNQCGLFRKDKCSCLDSTEELRFANSHCKDTFKAQKEYCAFFVVVEQETKVVWKNITEHIAMKSEMWVTETLRQNTKLPRDCFSNASVSDLYFHLLVAEYTELQTEIRKHIWDSVCKYHRNARF